MILWMKLCRSAHSATLKVKGTAFGNCRAAVENLWTFEGCGLLGTWRLVTLRNTSELETKVRLENFGFTVQCHDTRVVQKLKIKTVVDFKCELLHHLHTESRPAVSICFCISRNSWPTRIFSKTNSVRGLGRSGRSSVTSYFRIS